MEKIKDPSIDKKSLKGGESKKFLPSEEEAKRLKKQNIAYSEGIEKLDMIKSVVDDRHPIEKNPDSKHYREDEITETKRFITNKVIDNYKLMKGENHNENVKKLIPKELAEEIYNSEDHTLVDRGLYDLEEIAGSDNPKIPTEAYKQIMEHVKAKEGNEYAIGLALAGNKSTNVPTEVFEDLAKMVEEGFNGYVRPLLKNSNPNIPKEVKDSLSKKDI